MGKLLENGVLQKQEDNRIFIKIPKIIEGISGILEYESLLTEGPDIIIIVLGENMNTLELDSLALEYQGNYGNASGNLDLSNFVNNPFLNCEVSILCLGLKKEFCDFFFAKTGILRDNRPDSLLVVKNSI